MTDPQQQESTALTVERRAALALNAAERKQRFVELAKQSAGIITITNGDGYKEAHAARMLLKKTRVEVDKEADAVKADAVAFQKAVIALRNEIVGVIEPEEDRLQSLQDAYDAKIKAERDAAVRAEQERIAAEERARREAEEAQLAAARAEIEKQKAVLAAAQAEQARLLAEAEAARVRAEQEARERIAQAEREAAARIASAEADARRQREDEEREARLAREEADRKAREALEAEQAKVRQAEAEAQRKKIIEDARIASENERLARERRELEDAQRREREAKEAQERAERERIEQAERQQREAAEAAAQAERERIEEERRQARRAATEIMEGFDLLRSFVKRFAEHARFRPAVAAVRSFLSDNAEDTLCKHENTAPDIDFARCTECGWIKPGGDRGGMPDGGWFPSMEAADHWRKYRTYSGFGEVRPAKLVYEDKPSSNTPWE